MNPKLVMFCAFVFMIGTALSLFIEGSWFGTEEVGVVNELTGYTALQIQGSGLWAIPKQISGFMTHGLPKLIMWDYSFLEGNAALFKWVVLYPISAGVVWGLAQVFIPAISGMLSGLRGLLPI